MDYFPYPLRVEQEIFNIICSKESSDLILENITAKIVSTELVKEGSGLSSEILKTSWLVYLVLLKCNGMCSFRDALSFLKHVHLRNNSVSQSRALLDVNTVVEGNESTKTTIKKIILESNNVPGSAEDLASHPNTVILTYEVLFCGSQSYKYFDRWSFQIIFRIFHQFKIIYVINQ